MIPNKIYSNYRIYIIFAIYLGLFSTSILTVTGIMTYRNTNRLILGHQRQLIEKQLVIQIPIIIVSTFPYIKFTEYITITSACIKCNIQRDIETLFTNIVTIIFASPFFVSSTSFRNDVKRFILCQKRNFLRNNQIQLGVISIQ
jgi:hypothetical protein